jgi:hypothetical protein
MPRTTDLDPLAQKVVALMDAQNIKDKEVAEHLEITVSGLSKAFHRTGGLIPHINEIASFLSTTPEALMGSEAKLSKQQARPPVYEDFTVPTQSLIVRLAKESVNVYGRGRYVVLSPIGQPPTVGDLVAYSGPDGYCIRTFTIGSGNQIVLLHKVEASVPEVYPTRRSAPQMRVVLMFGEKLKVAQ